MHIIYISFLAKINKTNSFICALNICCNLLIFALFLSNFNENKNVLGENFSEILYFIQSIRTYKRKKKQYKITI